ncbi:class I SAM-dependent methyltransferase [Geomicrobium sp. JSM 1781026]|uniref:class I SAM-dependent methyltransferase n=1 Tax=Geomicrobium sp. JSM 1781026 TaxID=3344580 RepID=UPI0035C1FC64
MLVNEIVRMNNARKWMKSNESFLPTWHAYIGYRYGLFDRLEKPMPISMLAAEDQLDEQLLNCWVETGIAVGHLKKKSKDRVKSVKSIRKQMSKFDKSSVGVLVEEMMRLHIPTLLAFDQKLSKDPHPDEDDYGHVVAETSALIETIAYPKLNSVIKDTKAKHILDLGSGYGGYLNRIAADHPDLSLTGIEINEAVVQEAARRADHKHIRFKQEDILSEIEHDERPDLIMMNNALYYFNEGERSKIFDYIYRSLVSKGSFVMITPLADSEKGLAFPAAFNSFMSGHEDMHPLPTRKEIKQLADTQRFKIKNETAVVKEGGWHFFHLTKKD